MEEKKKKGRIREYIRQLKEQMIKKHNGTFVLYIVLRILVIAVLVLSLIEKRYESVATCFLVLVLFLVPSFLERKLHFELPSTIEKIILLFIYAAEIMGELQEFYIRVPWWDTMLHTMNGFLFAAFGFALVDILNSNPNVKLSLSPFYLAFVSFCFNINGSIYFVILFIFSFAMMAESIWEIFEFSMDRVIGTDMQKDTVVNTIRSVMLNPDGRNVPYVISGIESVTVNGQELGLGGYLDIGLIDTMKDLFVNFIGAVVFSVIGYFYVKSSGKNKFASRFIPITSKGISDSGELTAGESEMPRKNK